MPATLGHLLRNQARLTMTFDDGSSLFIDYRPGMMTPRQLHAIDTLHGREFTDLSEAEQTQLMDATTHVLASWLIDWDLMYPNPDGSPSDRKIPPTLDGLQDVDYQAQGLMLQAMRADQSPPKETPPTGSTPVDPAANGNATTAALSTPSSASLPMATSSPTPRIGTGI